MAAFTATSNAIHRLEADRAHLHNHVLCITVSSGTVLDVFFSVYLWKVSLNICPPCYREDENVKVMHRLGQDGARKFQF